MRDIAMFSSVSVAISKLRAAKVAVNAKGYHFRCAAISSPLSKRAPFFGSSERSVETPPFLALSPQSRPVDPILGASPTARPAKMPRMIEHISPAYARYAEQ